jgi:hypothetical protein
MLAALLVFCIVPSSRAQRSDASEPGINEIQSVVLDFGLEYMSSAADTVNALERPEETSVESDKQALRFKFATGLSAMLIATGPNPRVAAVDFVVLTSLQKRAVATTWGPRYFPDSYTDLVETLEGLELQARENASLVLDESQFALVDQAIASWWEANPGETDVTFVRFSELAAQRGQIESAEAQRGMMRSLKRATESIDHTRLMAERQAMFFKAMPVFTVWQTELTLYNLLDRPDIAQQRQELSEALAGVVTIASVSEEIRQILSEERAAALQDFDERIDEQQDDLLADLSVFADENADLARSLIDYIFWRGLVLVLVLCAGIFAALAATRSRNRREG